VRVFRSVVSLASRIFADQCLVSAVTIVLTFETASTYVFAERLIRTAEVRGSIPLCSTNRINDLGQGGDPAFFICHRFVTWSNRFSEIFNGSTL
jgi:hypothetical protein